MNDNYISRFRKRDYTIQVTLIKKEAWMVSDQQVRRLMTFINKKERKTLLWQLKLAKQVMKE